MSKCHYFPIAVQKIVNIRGDMETGDDKPRPRRTPFLNFDATTLEDIIDWNKDKVHEPVFTCKLSTEEVRSLIYSPLEVNYHPCHTQSTERVVKQCVLTIYIFDTFIPS